MYVCICNKTFQHHQQRTAHMGSCQVMHLKDEIDKTQEALEVAVDGLEVCEIYLRETGAIGLAVSIKKIITEIKKTQGAA